MKTRTSVIAVVFAIMTAGAAFAGSLEAPAAPNDPSSAMYTLESIYQRLATGAAGTKRVGPFAEQTSAPGSTGHTFDDVMSKAPAVDNVNGAKPEEVAKGKTFWGLRSDGTWGLQTGTGTAPVCTGALSPGGRWCNPNNGTLIDMTTGLVWLKDANCSANLAGINKTGALSGTDAMTWSSAVKSGVCGLTDSSVVGDWRLPTRSELKALMSGTEAVNSGSPGFFSNVKPAYYWSATNFISSWSATNFVFSVIIADVLSLYDGNTGFGFVKIQEGSTIEVGGLELLCFCLPIRGGQ